MLLPDDRGQFKAVLRRLMADEGEDNEEEEEDSEDVASMTTERFNGNDEELVAYVREFKAKVGE